jgi:hypothetical protein
VGAQRARRVSYVSSPRRVDQDLRLLTELWPTLCPSEHKVCHYCRPHHADRAFLSLNAVANGEVPPAAAVGFGFSYMGQRPVANANIVKNLGCRAVPPAIPASGSVSDIFDEHQELPASNSASEMTPTANLITNPTDTVQGGHGTPGCTEKLQPLTAANRLVRPAWTPPTTPVLTGEDIGLQNLEGDVELAYTPFNGRRYVLPPFDRARGDVKPLVTKSHAYQSFPK